MKNLKEKLRKQGGFTLIEMLIVVAIIAILIAIAIPMVQKALERAREATDAANERAALGMAMVEVLSDYTLGGTSIASATDNVVAYYVVDNNKGELVSSSSVPTTGFDYGKGTLAGAVNKDNAGKGIVVTYKKAAGSGATATYEDFDVDWTKP